MADPFDAGGMGGGDDWARNLMQFGLATMAAGSRPGAQLLGSLGEGGLAAMQNARQTAGQQSEMDLRRAQALQARTGAQGQDLNNQLLRMRLGMMQNMGGPLMQGQAVPDTSGGQVGTEQDAPSQSPPPTPQGMPHAPAAGTPKPQRNTISVPTGGQDSTDQEPYVSIAGVPVRQRAASGQIAPTAPEAIALQRYYDILGMPELAATYGAMVPKLEAGYGPTADYGQHYIPGGPADPAVVQQKSGAEAWGKVGPQLYEESHKPYDLRMGGVHIDPTSQQWVKNPDVHQVWNPQTRQYEWGAVAPTPSSNIPWMQGGAGASPTSPPVAGVTNGGKQLTYSGPPQTTPTPIPGQPQASSGMGQQEGVGTPARPGPGQEESLKLRAEHLTQLQAKINDQAQHAIEQNGMFDVVKQNIGQFPMGTFADYQQDLRKLAQSVGQNLGFETPGLDKEVGSFEEFEKNVITMQGKAAHDVSARAAVQEFNTIGKGFPAPTMSKYGAQIVTAQLQSMQDAAIAKQRLAEQWMKTHADLEGFEDHYQNNLSPMAFYLHRLYTDAPEAYAALGQEAQSNRQIRNIINNSKKGATFAFQNGLFSDQSPGQ